MKLLDRSLMTIEENGRKISFAEITLSIVTETIFMFFLSTLQTATVSGYSENATAVVSITGTIFGLATTLVSLITQGARINLNVSLGSGRRDVANIYAGTAFYICIFIGITAGSLLFFFAPQFLALMNMKSELMPTAIPHLRIRGLFFPIVTVLIYLKNTLICEGYSSRVLIVNVANSIATIAFCNFALYSDIIIFEDRVVTVSLAIGFSYLISTLLSVFFFSRYKCAFSSKCRWGYAKDILRLGIPSGMNAVSYQIAQTVTTSFIGILGIMVLNTKVYTTSIVALSYTVSSAIAQATGIFMGRFRGMSEMDKIQKMHIQNTIIAVLGNGVVSLILFALHIPIIGIFTKDAEIIKLAGLIMLIDIVVQVFRAFNHVNEHSLSSNGDVKVMLISSVTSCWVFGILCGYILGIKLGLGLPGIWIGFSLEEGFKTIVYSLRWKSKKWMITNIGK